MTLPRMPEAVIFDMDGLLFDTEVLYRQAVTEASAEQGRDFPPELYLTTIGLTGEASINLLRGHFGEDFDFTGLWDRTRALYRALVATQLRMKLGVVELLDELDTLGLKRAVATSSRHEAAEHHLGFHDLAARFQTVVAHGDYARSKPAPDPYLVAAERLGVAPENCLALEDSYNGLRAAAAAGMMVVMVPDLLEPTDEIRELGARIVESLLDVRALLRETAAS